jgi:hypothetical protein
VAVTIVETGIAFSATRFLAAPPYPPYAFTCPGSAQAGDVLLMRLYMSDSDLVTYTKISDWIIPDGVSFNVGSEWTELLAHRFFGGQASPSSGAYRSQWVARRLLQADLSTSWSFSLLTSGDSSWQDRGEYFLIRGAAALPIVFHETGTAILPRPPGGSGDYLVDVAPLPFSVTADDIVLSERKAKIVSGPPFLSISPAGNYVVSPIFSEDFFNHFISTSSSGFTAQTTISVGPPSGNGSVSYSVAFFHFQTVERVGTLIATLPPPTFALAANPETRGVLTATLPAPTFTLTASKFNTASAKNVMRRPAQDRRLRREKQFRVMRRTPSGDN